MIAHCFASGYIVWCVVYENVIVSVVVHNRFGILVRTVAQTKWIEYQLRFNNNPVTANQQIYE